MVRKEVELRLRGSDITGVASLLAMFAQDVGWAATVSRRGEGTRAETCVLLVQEFDDEDAAKASIKLLDDALTQVSSFTTVVR